jgi:DNA-binding MarR family transcriptional regulator
MSGDASEAAYGVDDATRALTLLMPRVVGRAKRLPPPEPLRALQLAPRHLSLLAYLVFDGPLGVKELAARLEVAPATVSLMVADLSRQGVLERREDEADRRRTIVSIAAEHQQAVADWLQVGGRAWQVVLAPLTPAQRRLFVETLQAYEREVAGGHGGSSAE